MDAEDEAMNFSTPAASFIHHIECPGAHGFERVPWLFSASRDAYCRPVNHRIHALHCVPDFTHVANVPADELDPLVSQRGTDIIERTSREVVENYNLGRRVVSKNLVDRI